jgi:hypothetical protein
MVFVSLDPFAVRKIFLVLAALLCLSVFCFADPVLMAQRYPSSDGPFSDLTELKRVDFPSHAQKLFPSGSNFKKAFRQWKSLFPESQGMA